MGLTKEGGGEEIMFSVLQKVRLRQPGFLKWLLSPFSSLRLARDMGKEFVVLGFSHGKYSGETIYYVASGSNHEDVRCLFEDELEPV